MTENEPLYFVLNFILNQATTAELNVIGEALKRRLGDGSRPGGPRGMAERLARNIQQQLGSTLDVKQAARRIVTDLIRSKEPGIQEHELQVLLDQWLPGTAVRRPPAEPAGPPPPDMMISMVATYLAAERGTLDPVEAGQLPEDWKQKYWEAFPQEVRGALAEIGQGRLTESAFWERMVNLLQG